ncbi:hypothetical protein AB0D14_35930 [Streptomyces sp. NPDC048484]|uniref:hypothetical protein n=1 Tax=Streptomyces sp. NPDC048484 TaxID=3155146 RepID=UPI0034265CCF
MTFYRVDLDGVRNVFRTMEEESEEVHESAQVLLDPETGSFTSEVSELLEYVGSGVGSAVQCAMSAEDAQ